MMGTPEDRMRPATPVTRQAIEFLTLWLEGDPDDRDAAVRHIASVLVADPSNSKAGAFAGTLNLGLMLLMSLAEHEAEPGQDPLEAARRILQELSLALPE